MTAKRNSKKETKRLSASAWRQGKTALITGASGGIGFDLTKIFAENGYNLVLVARNKDKLMELADHVQRMFGVSAKVLQKDLSDPAAPEQIYKEMNQRGIGIDVVVNNAGYGLLGPFAYSSKRGDLGMLQVNVTALVLLAKLFLPGMIMRGSGKILNVASTAGFQPGPLMANYYATKAYVLSFSVALANEVLGTGVSVSVLCPGPTPTGFQQRAGIGREPAAGKLAVLDSLTVARIAYEGLMAGKTIIVPGILNKLGTILVRLAPLGFVSRLIMRFHEQRS